MWLSVAASLCKEFAAVDTKVYMQMRYRFRECVIELTLILMEKDAIFLFEMFWCMRDCFVWASVEMQLFGNVLVQERVDVD